MNRMGEDGLVSKGLYLQDGIPRPVPTRQLGSRSALQSLIESADAIRVIVMPIHIKLSSVFYQGMTDQIYYRCGHELPSCDSP